MAVNLFNKVMDVFQAISIYWVIQRRLFRILAHKYDAYLSQLVAHEPVDAKVLFQRVAPQVYVIPPWLLHHCLYYL